MSHKILFIVHFIVHLKMVLQYLFILTSLLLPPAESTFYSLRAEDAHGPVSLEQYQGRVSGPLWLATGQPVGNVVCTVGC